MNKFLKISSTTFFMIGFTATSYASNWVDDYFDSAVTTQPGVFESQQRTYATFGSFNGRMKTHNDSLLTVSKPHIDVGCGGIDIFMGGFSYLNPEYMVEKAKKMIKVAPYVAFSLALQNMSTSVESIMDKANRIIDDLNGLQMDECKSAKALVVSAKDFAAVKSDAALQTIGSGLIQGTDTLWKDASKGFTDNPGDKTKAAINSSDMSTDGKSELLKEGSLLSNIGNKMGITSTRIDQMRALVGDVQISMSGSDYNFISVPGCSEATYDSLIKATPYQKSVGTSGVCSSTSGSSVQDYVNANIDDIVDKIYNNKKSSYSQVEKDFINKTPVPIISILNSATKYGYTQLLQTAEELKPIAARGYAFYMFMEMARNISDSVENYKDFISASTGKQFDTSHVTALNNLIAKAKDKRTEAVQNYNSTAGDLSNMYSLLASFKSQQDVIDSVVKNNKFALGRVF